MHRSRIPFQPRFNPRFSCPIFKERIGHQIVPCSLHMIATETPRCFPPEQFLSDFPGLCLKLSEKAIHACGMLKRLEQLV